MNDQRDAGYDEDEDFFHHLARISHAVLSEASSESEGGCSLRQTRIPQEIFHYNINDDFGDGASTAVSSITNMLPVHSLYPSHAIDVDDDDGDNNDNDADWYIQNNRPLRLPDDDHSTTEDVTATATSAMPTDELTNSQKSHATTTTMSPSSCSSVSTLQVGSKAVAREFQQLHRNQQMTGKTGRQRPQQPLKEAAITTGTAGNTRDNEETGLQLMELKDHHQQQGYLTPHAVKNNNNNGTALLVRDQHQTRPDIVTSKYSVLESRLVEPSRDARSTVATAQTGQSSQPGAYSISRAASASDIPPQQLPQQQQQYEQEENNEEHIRLVEADPITAIIPEAQPVTTLRGVMVSEQTHTRHHKQMCWVTLVIAILLVVVVSIFLIVAPIFVEKRVGTAKSHVIVHDTTIANAPSSAPSNQDQDHNHSHLLGHLLQSLPNHTLTSLKNPLSAQSQAFEWLLRHDDLGAMEEWRKEQLFAMATFFYAFGGPSWPEYIQSDWMDASRHECYWFSSKSTLYVFTEQAYKHLNNSPCNQHGQLEYLILPSTLAMPGQSRPTNNNASNYYGYEVNRVIPPEIQMLSKLTTLSLCFSLTRGTMSQVIPSEFYQMTNISNILLSDDGLSGRISSEFGLLTRLSSLKLRGNALSGPLPSEIGCLRDLETLTLTDNHLSGRIPSELGLLTRLTTITLNNNLLSGPVLDYIGWATNKTLWNLDVSNNRFSGTIPSTVGLQPQLARLQLQNNEFTGALVTELGLLKELELLDLSSNTLVGIIPSELAVLEDMRYLGLSNLPGLRGSIPMELSKMVSAFSLKGINITSNPGLEGNLPDGLCMLQEENCSFQMFFWTPAESCYVAFDCSDTLCGCNCTCPLLT